MQHIRAKVARLEFSLTCGSTGPRAKYARGPVTLDVELNRFAVALKSF